MQTKELAMPLFAYRSRPELARISLVSLELALQDTRPVTPREY